MKLYIGADHGGFYIKERTKDWLKQWGYEFEDVGAFTFETDDDYPQFAFLAARRVADEKDSKAILFCRSGGGMSIAANRVKGIRAVDCLDIRSAEHARKHNDANVLSIPADWLSEDEVKTAIQTFLQTPFSNEERHVRRIAMLDAQNTRVSEGIKTV